MPTDANPLIRQDYRPVPGWSLIVFGLALPVIGYAVVRLLPNREMMTVLGAFFLIGLLAVIVAVAPLGKAAFPALGLRPANWKYPVLGAFGTLFLSVAVSQIGIEPQGMKQVIEVVREPHELILSLLLLSVLAPIVEELVFRGLILAGFMSRMNWVWAVIAQGIVFGIAHVDPARGAGNVGLALILSSVGVVFGGAAYLLRRIAPTMLAHAILNAIVLVVVLTR